jgi:hypothetical protein
MTLDDIAAAMATAVRECLTAERNRAKKLKFGAPASDYCQARIARLTDALNAYEASMR